jgi:hypothetical protein
MRLSIRSGTNDDDEINGDNAARWRGADGRPD